MLESKLTPSLSYLDAPIKSEKWKNLGFDKNGHSYIGCQTHSSESAAKIVSSKLIAGIPIMYLNGTVEWKNHSHTIQIPWRD